MYQLLTGVLMLTTLAATSGKLLSDLPLPRSGYASGVLSSNLVVAGGSYWDGDVKKWTPRVDIFDPSCNCWRERPSMPIALSDSAAVVVGGSLFVMGGTDGAQALRSVYAFDGRAWVLRPELELPEHRMYASAATDGSHIFLIGGIGKPSDQSSGMGSMWMIDPARASAGWIQLPDCACAWRSNFGLALVTNKLMVLGGIATNMTNVTNLQDIWSLDLGTRKWKREGNLPEGRRAVSAAADGGDVLLFGGYTDDFSSDILRLHHGTVARVASMPEAIAAAPFFQIGTQWYITGGEAGFRRRGAHTWSIELAPNKERKSHD